MNVKRTISFSDTTLEALEELVPKSKRSSFINNAVIEALRKIAKERALDALENFEKMNSEGKSIVETLRDIRQEESDRLVSR